MNENEQKKVNAEERRQKIREMIKGKEPWNINKSEIAREFGVSVTCVCNDVDLILKEIPNETVQEIADSIKPYFRKALAKATSLMNSNNEGIQAKGIHALMATLSEYTKFRESYGLKEKEPEKQKLTTNVTFIDVDTRSFLTWCKENGHEEVVKLFDKYCETKNTKLIHTIEDLPYMNMDGWRSMLKSDDKESETKKTEEKKEVENAVLVEDEDKDTMQTV